MTLEDEILLQDLRDLQVKVRNGLMDNYLLGICGGTAGAHHERLGELFPHWPEYSGDPSMPVPDNFDEFGGSASLAFGRCMSMFSTDHEYGRARRRLLDFLIHTLEQLQ
jgi:hypothetical protein